MKQRRRIMIALILILALAIAGGTSLWVWHRFAKRDTEGEETAETAEVFPEENPSNVPTREPVAPSADPSEDPSRASTAEPSEESAGKPVTAPASESSQGPGTKLSEEPTEEPVSPNQTAPMGSPYFVSLYSVELINSRPRAETATSTEVKAETWEMWGVMNWHKNLTYMNTQLGDIPLLEAYVDDGQEKPLLLFLHGLGEDKETIIEALSAFAEAGYHAVGVDAFNQGDRLLHNSSVDTWAAMLITVADVDPIIEYFRTAENVDAENFVLAGFSMGAVEATAYLQLGSYTPKAILALCGMCQYDAWQVWQQEDLAHGWLSDWWGTVWTFPEWQKSDYTGEKYKAILSMDISNNLNRYADVPILCCVGTADQYFNASNIAYVVGLVRGSGNKNAECIVYPFGTHQITNTMLMDSILFLNTIEE